MKRTSFGSCWPLKETNDVLSVNLRQTQPRTNLYTVYIIRKKNGLNNEYVPYKIYRELIVIWTVPNTLPHVINVIFCRSYLVIVCILL